MSENPYKSPEASSQHNNEAVSLPKSRNATFRLGRVLNVVLVFGLPIVGVALALLYALVSYVSN